ncbi:uncharacterized protein TNCV_934961 [Trichonephila clavipes]|nr:uncharacterized protein TNCV_934961 [Trichonephila clavipes]
MWVAEWNEVVFIDESRICLQHHDVWIRVWRHRGERMLNRCVMHRHTCPAPVYKQKLWTCMVLKANDRRTSCPYHDEFRGPRSDYVRQGSIRKQQQTTKYHLLTVCMC